MQQLASSTSGKLASLDAYVAGYIKRRVDAKDAKPGTVKKWQATEKQLTTFFGKTRDLRTITQGDADAFRLHLMGSITRRGGKMQTNTISKHIRVARLFFNAALRDEVVVKNPFSGVDSGDRRNAAREYFVTRKEADACIEAAPNLQWKLIIALARYGGLRTPSEQVRLKWTDILWDSDRMIVHSPKLEGYEGRETRIVPIFPELKKYLDQAYFAEAEKSEFVITQYRCDSQNLRTTFLKIVERAGLKPWPKLFQNMRASRQTELEETFPTHVVCKWMGNSPKVAQKHYLQVTDSHFEKAVQNPVQQASAMLGTAPLPAPTCDQNTPENAENIGIRDAKINPTRARTFAESTGKTVLSEDGGAPGGAIDSDSDSVARLRQQALTDLQRAWKSIRRMETLSEDPAECKTAERALSYVDKAFAVFEGGKR